MNPKKAIIILIVIVLLSIISFYVYRYYKKTAYTAFFLNKVTSKTE